MIIAVTFKGVCGIFLTGFVTGVIVTAMFMNDDNEKGDKKND